MTTIEDVLNFWFAPGMEERWFVKDPDFDEEVRRRLQAGHEEAAAGRLDVWMESPEGCLALVILLDQVPRNIHRNSPLSYATDAQARAVAKQAIAKGLDKKLTHRQRGFLYMPLEHSEDQADQELALEVFGQLDEIPDLLYWAKKHEEIIRRFGRFPHRNEVLGRICTPEEVAFLKQPGSSF